jgi:parallel beta-helix repeat protein
MPTNPEVPNSITWAANFQPSYDPHEPIVINHVSAFSIFGFNGSGLKNDPFVIEGYSIVTDGNCIEISNVNAYFVIRDCLLSSNSYGNGIGIFFSNVMNGHIESCDVELKETGIKMDWSYGASIEGNTIHDSSRRGIELYNCFDSIIHDNSYTQNYSPILILGSQNCTVVSNTIYENTRAGIDLYSSQNCTLADNILFGNGAEDISISSEYCEIRNNTMASAGILMLSASYLDEWHHNMSNNIVNSLPVAYFWALNDTVIDINPYGQVIFGNCHNLTITNGHFYDVGSSIQIGHCSTLKATDIIQEGGLNGISGRDSESCTFENITMSNLLWSGFWLVDFLDCSITNCTIMDGSIGIQLQRVIRCTVVNNTLTSCNYRGIDDSRGEENIFINNTVTGNDEGIGVGSGTNCLVANNTVMWNNEVGIYVDYSDGCMVFNNTVTDNSGYGIHNGPESVNSEFVNNTVAWNYMSNAYDEGSGSVWDDGLRFGNTWGDYKGVGNYTVPGPSASVDHYPVRAEFIPPSIVGPSDMTYEIGKVPDELNWFPVDPHPDSFTILLNGSQYDSDIWDGSSISVSTQQLSELDVGLHNFTLIVSDTCGNLGVDSVFVIVTPDVSLPEIQGPDDIELVEGTIGRVLTWLIHDHTPLNYSIYRNGSLLTEYIWESEYWYVNITLDGLEAGHYNFTIIVEDSAGHTAADVVLVTVLPAPTETVSSTTSTTSSTSAPNGTNDTELIELSMVVAIGSVAVMLLVIIVACRSTERRR